MDDLIEEHIAALALTHSPDTIQARHNVLRRLHEDLPKGLGEATTEQLRAWLSRKHLSPWSRYTYTSHVLAAYRWWTRRGNLDGDPTADIERPSQPRGIARPIKEMHLAILLAQPEPMPTIALLGGYGGLRRSEICDVDREHVDEDLIIVVRPKGGHGAQTVPTHPIIWEHIKDLPDGPVVRWHGGRMRRMDLTHLWERTRLDLGLPKELVPHMLRHRYGTVIQREGRDLRVTQECMRHASVASTQIYTQVTDRQRAAAVALLPPVRFEPGPSRLEPAQTA